METERSFEAPPGPIWRTEPFRLFFPLGVLLGWIGIGHWLFYAVGFSDTYSCSFHGLVQMQSFMMAFAVGFLLTAVPRRTRSAPPTAVEIVAAAGALIVSTAGAVAETVLVQQTAYALLFLLLVRFALRRFLAQGATRRPPAAFVLIPIGFLQGLVGSGLLVYETVGVLPPWAMILAELLITQGVFLSLAVGVGSLVLPLMAGATPPPDLGTSRREQLKAVAYAVAGVTIVVSLVLEARDAVVAGPLLRAAVLVGALGIGGGAWRSPSKPGLHRRLVWLAVWLMPLGLVLSALWPDYRVPALHILFIGGFGLLAFGVATHVILGHLDMDHTVPGYRPVVTILGLGIVMAMLARVAADWSDTYFSHLGWAAGTWLVTTAVWLGFIGPKLWHTSPPRADS